MLVASGLSKYYIDRYNFFNSIKKLLQEFNLNINFKKDKLHTILTKKELNNSLFSNFITIYQQSLKAGKSPDFSAIKILEQEESVFLVDIINSLGRDDALTEKNKLQNFLTQADEISLKCKTDKEKKVPLIIKLGFLISLALCVVLI